VPFECLSQRTAPEHFLSIDADMPGTASVYLGLTALTRDLIVNNATSGSSY
jgi:hypothetical protein